MATDTRMKEIKNHIFRTLRALCLWGKQPE